MDPLHLCSHVRWRCSARHADADTRGAQLLEIFLADDKHILQCYFVIHLWHAVEALEVHLHALRDNMRQLRIIKRMRVSKSFVGVVLH